MASSAPGAITVYWSPKRIGESLGKAIGSASKGIFNAAQSFDNTTKGWDDNTAAYAKTFLPAITDVNNFFGGATTGIAGIETSVNKFYANVLNSVRKETGTFSDHVAATVTDLSLVFNNPLDFQVVSNSAARIMNRVFPGSSNSLNRSIQNLHLDKLVKAPSLLFSGIQRLARAIDNLLSIPIAFLSSIYYGVIGLIRQIGTTLNNLIQGFQQFLFDFLDEATGGILSGVLQLLGDLGTLAGQIGGIASFFGGVNFVTTFSTQITTFTNEINSIVTTPLDTLLAVLPTSITQGYLDIMNFLQNPESIINDLIPAELSAILSNITSVTGFGFNGGNAYNFGQLLNNFRGGVINSILNSYSNQFNILAPLLGGGMNGLGTYNPPISYTATTNNGYIQGKKYRFNPDTNVYELIP